MFANIRVALNIDVVQDRRIIPRRGFVNAACERSEPRNGIDRHHVLRSALTKDTADTGRHRRLADAALAGDHRDHVLLADMSADTFPKFSVVPLGRRFTGIDRLDRDPVEESAPPRTRRNLAGRHHIGDPQRSGDRFLMTDRLVRVDHGRVPLIGHLYGLSKGVPGVVCR